MYVHGTLECLLPLHTDLLISDVHTSVGCELHVLMSWLTMTNGSLLTAICLFHMLTHTHTRTHTHTHTHTHILYLHIRKYPHTHVRIYLHARMHYTHTPGHQERWWCSLQPVSIRHHHHQTREDAARHYDDQRVS